MEKHEFKSSTESVGQIPHKKDINMTSGSKRYFYFENNDVAKLLYIEIMPKFARYSTVDVCFIYDTTANMSKYKPIILNTIASLRTKITEKTFIEPRIAIINFKDKKDKEPISKLDFTRNEVEIKKFIEEVKCEGGDDTCEDVVTPLKEALTLDWRSDMHFVYLLLGSPTHGKSYHLEQYTDHYMDDDKDKMLEKLSAHYRKTKLNLIVIRCNNSIDMMVKIMKKYYNSPMSKLQVVTLPKTSHELLKVDISNLIAPCHNDGWDHFQKYVKPEVDEVLFELDDMALGSQYEGICYSGLITNQIGRASCRERVSAPV